MKFDIEKYYENIDLDILYNQVNNLIKNKNFIKLAK